MASAIAGVVKTALWILFLLYLLSRLETWELVRDLGSRMQEFNAGVFSGKFVVQTLPTPSTSAGVNTAPKPATTLTDNEIATAITGSVTPVEPTPRGSAQRYPFSYQI